MTATLYRKRPVTIEARQVPTSDYRTDFVVVADWCGGYIADERSRKRKREGELEAHHPYDKFVIKIETLEGTMTAQQGDYIIKGVHGEFYPCKPAIFHATYESVLPGAIHV